MKVYNIKYKGRNNNYRYRNEDIKIIWIRAEFKIRRHVITDIREPKFKQEAHIIEHELTGHESKKSKKDIQPNGVKTKIPDAQE